MSLDRRQFLRLCATAAAGSALGSCVRVSPRYRRPERLTHPEELLVLANASVIDVRGGRVLRGHCILLRRGRILDVFDPNQTETLRPDRQIDLAGAYVLPGLINAHCHMTLPGGIGFGPGFFALYERRGTIVALHHTTVSGLLKGIEGGVLCFEHMATDGPIPEAALRVLINRHWAVVPTASVAFALAYERRGDPHWGKGFTLRIARERLRVMPELVRQYCEPELVESTLGFFGKLSEPGSFERRHLLPWPDPSTMNAAADIGASNTRALYEAGVSFGVGNDGGVPLIFPGALGLELVLLEEQGIKPADLLRMATYDNARLLGIDTELGTIERGKVADLAVLQENPLETVRHAMAPTMVFQAGELAYRA